MTSIENNLINDDMVCKVIQTIYLVNLIKDVTNKKRKIYELNPEEFLKVSELIRDEITEFNLDLVDDIICNIAQTRFEEYSNYIVVNTYYYLHLFYKMIEVKQEQKDKWIRYLNATNINIVDIRMKETLINLIKYEIKTCEEEEKLATDGASE